MSVGRTVELLAPPHQTTRVAKLALTGPQAGQPASRQARIYPPDATRWGSTTLERANPLRLVRPWRSEPGFRGGEFQYSIFNIQCPSSWNHFSRQAAKAQRGFLEGRPPCRPGNPDVQNATMQGLTPLQIRFEPQRAQRTQRTFGWVGRTLSGLSARGGVSRAVGAENFMIQCSISNFQGNSRNHFSRQDARLRQGYGGQAKTRRGILAGMPCPAFRPTINDEQPTTTAPNYFQFQLRTQRMTEE